MSVVDHHDGAILLGQVAQAGEGTDISVHRENAVRDQQLPARLVLYAGELLLGFDIGGKTTPASETPITPIIIGDGARTMEFSRQLFQEGVLGTGIVFPTVPEGKARVRTIMTATHTRDELEQALEVLKVVGRRMGVLA